MSITVKECSKCKNGPVPDWYCSGCRFFKEACNLMGLDPEKIVKEQGETIKVEHVDNNQKNETYTETQQAVIRQYLNDFNNYINGWIKNNHPIDKAKEEFLKLIFDNILKTARNSKHCDKF